MSSNQRWTKKDVAILAEYYTSKGPNYCVNLLDRTYSSIIHKAGRLKLTPHSYWSEDEDRILKQYYHSEGALGCAKFLRRGICAIIDHASKLDLSTLIVSGGRPQKQVLAILDQYSVLSLCKKHGKSPHEYRNSKIYGCVYCRRDRGRKNSKLPRNMLKAKLKLRKYRKTELGKWSGRIRSRLRKMLKNTTGRFSLLTYSPKELVSHLRNIRDRHNNKCPLCDRSYDDVKETIDHIVPLSTATNRQQILELFDLSNLSLLCDFCNKSKNNKEVYYV